MRIVTWNINGLGSLRFPFHIHAARSHAYPAAARGDGSGAAGSSPRELPADDFDYDDTALTDTPTPQTVDTSATASADAAATTAAAAGLSPHSPAFPAFPFERRPLTPQLVHSHDELVEYFQADIVCFQEVKLGRARMDLLAKAGYSGVATFTRIGSACPVAAEEGVTGTWPNQSVGGPSSPSGSHPSAAPIGHNSAVLSCLSAAELRELDSEGRCVLTDHGAFLLFNCYIPNAGESRNDFKLRYLELLSLRIRQCQAEGRQVVVVGDINIAATRLDHCAPEPFELDDGSRVPFEESPSRQWWRSHVADTSEAAAAEAVATAAAGQQQQQQSRLVDVLRCEFPTQRKAYTCWNTKTGARAGNYGSRIDYILASSAVASATHSSRILAHVQGSDHCPVQCEVDVQRLDGWRVGSVPPALCSQWWPELSGQQKKLSSFFTKRDSSTTAEQQPVDSEEVVTLRASAAGPSNTAVSMKSAPLTTQPKRPISETVSKSGQKKRKPSHADTAPSAVANATLLSYFPAAAKPTPAKSAAASASAAADIDTAFQTDRLDGIQQHLTPNATVNHSSAPPAVLNPKADVDSSHSSDRCADRVEIDQPADVAMAPPASNPARRSSAPASPPAPNSSATSTPLFSPPPPAPLAADSFARLFTQSSLSVLCDHSLPARMWSVNKKGPNHGRQFYCCNVPPPDNCKFWSWLSELKKRRNKQQQQQQQQQRQTSGEQSHPRTSDSGFVSARSVQAQLT